MRTELGKIVHRHDLLEQLMLYQRPQTFLDTHYLTPALLVRKWSGFLTRHRRPHEKDNLRFYQYLHHLANHHEFNITPGIFEEYTDRARHDIYKSHTLFELGSRIRLERALRNTIFEPEDKDLYEQVLELTDDVTRKHFPSDTPNDKNDKQLLNYSFYKFIEQGRNTYVVTDDNALQAAIQEVPEKLWNKLGRRDPLVHYRHLKAL